MKFKLYEEFLNESVDKRLERATELAILYTLKQLLPNGGNNSLDPKDLPTTSSFRPLSWEDIDPIFEIDGPDLFINFDGNDIGEEFLSEFNYLWSVDHDSDHTISVYVEDKFEDYGLSIESLTPDENIVHVSGYSLLSTGYNDRNGHNNTSDIIRSKELLNKLVQFYRIRKKKIKDLEQKYKLTLTSNKYGL